MAESFLQSLGNLDTRKKIQLTSVLHTARRKGDGCPHITSDMLQDVLTNGRPMPIPDRANGLLKYLAADGKPLGTVAHFTFQPGSGHSDALCIWTASEKNEEVLTLAEHCHSKGWIELKKTDGAPFEIMIMPSGHEHLEGLDLPNAESDMAFVAMWLDDEMNDAYDLAIVKAIQDAGFTPFRVDRHVHNGKIDDEIIAKIRQSRFLVADFTHDDEGARGSVYFEAGFAMALQIPVIFTCREDRFDVHFDTRQYRHIVWKELTKFRKDLAEHISAVVW